MFARLGFLAAVLLIAFTVLARTSHGAGPERAYVVRAGDTLWSVAEERYEGDTRAAVWRLRERNGLAGSTIHPGQKLVLP